MSQIKIKQLGLTDYVKVWEAMQDFTKNRGENTPDELWVVEHPSVFTLGRNGEPEHILKESNIPIVKVDRGGQVTYHGPGQIVIYFLLDLHRRKLGIRRLVTLIEEAIIELLAQFEIQANSESKAPGVYVEGKKIAALGLRVSKGRTTHGLSLNVDMDLSPFSYINPCGYKNLEITQTRNLGIDQTINELANKLHALLIKHLDEQLKEEKAL